MGAEPIELNAFAWMRVQAVLTLRDSSREAIEKLRLVHASGTSVPPTGVDAAEGSTRARFNVMCGPDLMPLEPGRWTLHDGQGPVRWAAGRAALEARTFAWNGGALAVAPTLDANGALTLDVDLTKLPLLNDTLAKRLRRWWRRFVRFPLFDGLVRLHRALPHDGRKRVLFTSDAHAALSGNLAVVHNRMLERGLDREVEIQTLFRPGVASGRSWSDRWRLPRLLARADVILLDDFQPAVYRLPPRAGTRVVQLWHASGAFKTVGYSRIGKSGGPSPFSRRHKNYTHAIVSGAHDVPFYAEAFGIPEARVVPTGIPRMDRYFNEVQRTAAVEETHRRFPVTEGRMTILVAPTFRGDGPRDASYPLELLDLAALHAICERKNAAAIIKLHPFIRERPVIPVELADRIVDATDTPMDVNDMLFAVDLLVTDYSSIVFEYSTLRRPMLFFAYDLDDYVASRDFYEPFEQFVPGRIVRTFDELLTAIERDDYEVEKVAAFASEHFDHLDGTATDRVIDELILG